MRKNKPLFFVFLAALALLALSIGLGVQSLSLQKEQALSTYQLAGVRAYLDHIGKPMYSLVYEQDDPDLITEKKLTFGPYDKATQKIPLMVAVEPKTDFPVTQASLTMDGTVIPLKQEGQQFHGTLSLAIQDVKTITGVTFQGEGREATAKVRWVAEPKRNVLPSCYSQVQRSSSGAPLIQKGNEQSIDSTLTFAFYDFPPHSGTIQTASLLLYVNGTLTETKEIPFRHTTSYDPFQDTSLTLNVRVKATVPQGSECTCVFEATDSNGFRYRHTALICRDVDPRSNPEIKDIESSNVTQVFDANGTHLFDLLTGHTWSF
ncbi:MAG: hypothetical protein SOR61_04350 [Evtepia sp.]|uniref:hypothetical protein n=1 Tax=Evtepia sp. TaxID=2773933 RepID=UPI002A74A3F8|nr:hypothetical protein [Evtepia sp.]MDY3014413.1 hypothetical protein [Evtepia sp.]